MGRNKGQRTKNNARPSNSSRSAELLGASAPSFIGFTTVKTEEYASIKSGFSVSNNTELPSCFQMVFKKMNKKNATTKFKALQELTDLCSSENLSDVENILSYWCRFYCSLSIDVNHRVREAVQLAHATILKRVGKAIAVYLKELAGPWFVAQYDTYPPAASAASNSFNATFPPQKFIHAIIHCQDEILNYICDNIVDLSPQTLSTNNSFTPEEIETQYQRLIISSLQAYGFYLKTVKSCDIGKTEEYHKKLISSNKFWKLAKNELPSIKTAYFSTLTALMCYANNIVTEEKKKMLTTIVNSLDETEPALLIAVWECLLISTNKIEDWHTVVNLEKLVLPKLWRVLRNGGQNCASIVYPHLLPFLSHFSKFEMNKITLFTNFFENMRQGFSAKSVKLSRSETTIVVTSFFECFRYVILINSSNDDICQCLLKNQLMYMIESCMSDQSMRSNFFNQLNSLIRYWSKNCDNHDCPAYVKLLKIFWLELMSIFNRLIDDYNKNHNITTKFIVSSMAELLLYLNKEPSDDRRNMKVTFWDSQKESSEPSSSATLTSVTNDNNTVFLKQVEQFITKLCINYFKRITDKRKIVDLVKIVMIHERKELLIALAKTFDENANLLDFYNQYLRILQTSDDVEKEDLINFIFIIMSYMSNSEKNVVLHAFLEVDDMNILKIAVQFAFMDKYRKDAVIRKWYKQDVITNTLVLTAQEVLSSLEFTDSDEKLFLKAFEPALDGDLIVSNEAICGILSLFCLMVDKLPWNNEKQVERITNLLSRLLDLSWTHREINKSAIKLLRALFSLLFTEKLESNESDVVSPIKKIVEETWTKGLYEIKNKMSNNIYNENIKYFTSIIWEKMLSKNYTSDSMSANEPLIYLSVNFINTIIKIDQIKSNELLNNFIMESEVKNMMKYISNVVLHEEVITGNLYTSNLILEGCVCNELFNINLCNMHIESNMVKCFKWALYSSKILNNLLKQIPEILNISEIFTNILYVATLAILYVKHNIHSKQSIDVYILKENLKIFIKYLGQQLSDDFHNKIMSTLLQLLLSFGGIYQYIIKFYYTTFKNHIDFCKLTINNDSSLKTKCNNDDISLQTMQVLWNSEIYKNLKEYLSLNEDNIMYKIFLARNKLEDIELLEEIFDEITKRQKNKPQTLLLDCDIHEITWKDFTLSLEIISFFNKCVVTIPQNLLIFKWDIIELCLASWNLSIKKSINYLEDFKVKSLIIGVNKLYTSIQLTMNKKNLDPSLLDEWKQVFATELQRDIFETWIKLAELHYEKKDLYITSTIPLKYIGMSLTYFDSPIIKNDKLQKNGQNELENQIIELLLKCLYSPVQNLQIGTFVILNNIIDVLVERDKVIIEIENFDSKLLNICKFDKVLKTTQNIVNTMLIEFKLCDIISCRIQPYTDSYTYTISYLYSWIIVLNMCAKANRDLRYQYAEILKNDLFSNLLNNIFRLMPGDEISQIKSYRLIEMFSTAPTSNFTENWTEDKIEHLVCYIYIMCLKYLPVLVRQWLSITDSRIQAVVDKITTVYISPLLVKEEFECDTLKHIDNMQIEKNQYRREIVAFYHLDDTKLEIIITLPLNYPLCSATVESGKHVNGKPNQKNCHMQLSIFLKHQNGTIWDGIMLWKANLDKKFEGIEECYICLNIFHIRSYQIPKLSCHTCRKKFHASCLYKWFTSSYKSTCPLCRNAFPL